MRVGVFGGTFNPPHNGHRNSVQQILSLFKLDKLLIVPTNQSPLRGPAVGANPQQRLKMARLAFSDLGSKYEVSDIEVARAGTSFTIDTLSAIHREVVGLELYLIIGADQWLRFSEWKDSKRIVEISNVVVTSRPGCEFNGFESSLPEELKPLVKSMTSDEVEMLSGNKIHFVKLADTDVSATNIRYRLGRGEDVSTLLPKSVENYVTEQGIYRNVKESVENLDHFVRFCSQVLSDKKALGIVARDLRGLNFPMEIAVVASGTSRRQAAALAEAVSVEVKNKFHIAPLSVEGREESRWIVIDYGAVMIHIFYDFTRQEYRLEDLWSEGTDMDLKLT